jgi:hypothetical protein
VSFTCGSPPAIELSGTPVFLGEGGGASNEYDWYVLVCIFLFEDIRAGCIEENARSAWLHCAAPGEANRKSNGADDANGAMIRCNDIAAMLFLLCI